MPIDRYREKRDFAETPEPRGRLASGKSGRRFVVHRHEARRLHYDLRLEMEGVLKSWAVPKVFSYTPSDKRLAIRTEDHPLQYVSFEGVIPQGQYGAGTMAIWDHGTYDFLGETDPITALEAGKLELRFDGGRLRGEWHMVKMKKEPNQWLLFKSRDSYARDAGEPAFAIDVTRKPRRGMPQRVKRMEPQGHVDAFEDPDWLFESDLPGKRILVAKQGDEVRFRGSRRKLDQRLPRIVQDLLRVRAEQALLEGVLVGLDERLLPNAAQLDEVLAGRVAGQVQLYLFDLLFYEHWDLRPFSLLERKAALASILPRLGHVVYVPHERSRGGQLLEAIVEAGWGGCIAKRVSSSYQPGPSPDWKSVNLPKLAAARASRGGGSKKSQPQPGSQNTVPPDYVRFTNLDKVLWPQEGYTKGDLIDYYDGIADEILPYLHDRPLSLQRFPDGIEGESFFQKNAPGHTPDWVETTEVTSREGRRKTLRYILCNQRRTLLYLANLASMELHPWSSRMGSLEQADWAILDLDPSTNDYAPVAKLGREAGKALRGIGLRPFVKTSGSRGLHVYIPLQAGYSYDQARMFTEGIARYLTFRFPDIATVERVKPKRNGRVYLDFLQNRRGQTIVAPYSVRPRPGATVSTPLDWDEVTTDAPPSFFTMQTVLTRVERHGDLFRGALDDPQDLRPGIDALRELLKDCG